MAKIHCCKIYRNTNKFLVSVCSVNHLISSSTGSNSGACTSCSCVVVVRLYLHNTSGTAPPTDHKKCKIVIFIFIIVLYNLYLNHETGLDSVKHIVESNHSHCDCVMMQYITVLEYRY